MIAILWLAFLGAGLGCGVAPDRQIADEFHERLAPRDPGWVRVPCKDRVAKVERVRGLVPLGLELRARIREYDTPATPQLHERIMAFDMRGLADDYRCVVQDFTQIDLDTEPDFEDARGLVANVYILKGTVLMKEGQPQAGWDHVLDALRLYRAPVGPGVERQLGLYEALSELDHLLDAHPPPPATLDALAEAVDAAALPVPVVCAGLRHELLTIATIRLRVHFGQRERELMARRYGLNFAMRTWRTSQRPGTMDGAVWNELRDAHDLLVPDCTKRPLGMTLQHAAEPLVRLEMLHPPTGLKVRVASNRLNQAGVLSDIRVAALARLRGQRLRHVLGRDPTTAELALSFGRRPKNPWDGRYYTMSVADGAVDVVRGPYQHRVPLERRMEKGSGVSYPQLPKAAP